jgi:hypothetical protein
VMQTHGWPGNARYSSINPTYNCKTHFTNRHVMDIATSGRMGYCVSSLAGRTAMHITTPSCTPASASGDTLATPPVLCNYNSRPQPWRDALILALPVSV